MGASPLLGFGERGGGHARQAGLDAQVGGHAVDDVHVALRARGEFRVVGHHHDGGALAVDFLQQLHHPARHLRVEVAGGFVGEQQARRAGERTRDGGTLLLAAGEFGRVVLHARAQADARERIFDARLALGRAHAAITQRHVDVVEQVEVGDQVEALEDEADLLVAQLAARIVRHPAHVLAIEDVLPAGEGFQQAGDVEEGRLARARRAGDGDELAFAHMQVERAQRVGFDEFGAVDLGDLAHVQHDGVSFFVESCVGIRIQWIEICSASPNWSLPETTMRSPSFTPSSNSTALMLLAPTRTGRLMAVSPSITHALRPPPSSTNGPRSTCNTFLRVSITMRADSRWFWRRPGGCLPEKRRRLVTSPFTTSGETAATCAWYGAPPARISAGMPMPRSRAKLSGMRISTSNSDRSTTLSTGAFCATLARCATCTWPTWPSKGARSVSASTWRWISTTTERWRSASRRLLRVSRPAPSPVSTASPFACDRPISALFSASCAFATSTCATAPPSKARW